MNLSELVAIVARRSQIEPSIVYSVLDGTFDLIAMTLAADEEVIVRGFGKFRPVHRNSRSMRNPKTGAPVPVGPRVSAGFRPSAILRKRLNGEDPL